MAQSPAHRFGQIIGEVLEAGVLPLLDTFAREHGLYLDKKGDRPCRRGKKCSWVDLNGNTHDLDFVLERGGTAHKIGVFTPHESLPVANETPRQFLRIVSSGVHGREDYFTVNPLMGI